MEKSYVMIKPGYLEHKDEIIKRIEEIGGKIVAEKTLNLDKAHRYIGGITQVYKDCGLINDDNSFIQKKSKWKIEDDKFIIVIE